MLSLRVGQRRKGKRKGPYHRWRAFEIRELTAHDTSRPAWAVVVVVVEVSFGKFMVLTISAGHRVWQACSQGMSRISVARGLIPARLRSSRKNGACAVSANVSTSTLTQNH